MPVAPDASKDKTISYNVNWAEGDWTIISSDGIYFKAPSKVFWMLDESDSDESDSEESDSEESDDDSEEQQSESDHSSQDSDDEERIMSFSDDEIETSDVIEQFLNLAVKSELDLFPGLSDTRTVDLGQNLIKLVRFFQKWKCAHLLRQVQLCCAEGLLMSRMSPKVVFVVACEGQNLDLCEIALNKMYEALNAPQDRGTCDSDSNLLPLELWKLLSREHAWAYLVASERAKIARDRCDNPGHAHDLGSEFVKVVRTL